MAQFVIPTIFTAVDRMSRPIAAMGNSMSRLNTTATSLNATASTSASLFGDTGRQMMDYAKGVAISGALIGGGIIPLMNFEKELANLKALTGVSGSEFERFKGIIGTVATTTKTSSVEVATAFTTIANAMPQLLQDAQGLGDVTSASILLAKAARMDLEPAAESVTTILNQFGKGAKDAAGLVDLMAAGSKYGSAEISDLAETMREFGAQAKIAGVSLQESVGITELVSKFRKGSQAGIELRNVLIEMSKGAAQDPKAIADMQRLGVNIYKVADSTVPLADRLLELKKVAHDSNALFHIFGKENQAMAATVLQNAEGLKPLVQQIGETGVAEKMAAENTKTLWSALKQLRAAWVNIVTLSKGGNWALTVMGNTIRFVGDHLGTLLNIALPLVGIFTAYKAITLGVAAATRIATVYTTAYNFVQGLLAVTTGTLNGELLLNATAAKGAAAGMRVMNISANSLLLTFTRIAAVTGVIYGVMKLFERKDEHANRMASVMAHLPEGVDREKFSKQFGDILSPGHISVKDRLKGVKSWYPQETFDTLATKYYDDPRKRMDSVQEALPAMVSENLNYSNSVRNDTAVNVYLNVDKNNNITATSKTGGSAVPVKISSTGNTRSDD